MNQVKKFRKALSLLLTSVMILSMIPLQGSAEAHSPTVRSENEISQAQSDLLREIRLEREINQGLIGFEGDYALPDDHSPVSVIVVFETAPAQVQVIEARAEGVALTHNQAVSNVESAHAHFLEELNSLFRGGLARSASYEIQQEYRNAMNGVSIVVPANRIEEMAAFSSVRAIFPDATVTLDPIDEDLLEETVARHLEERADRNPPGMAPGRGRMGADKMHSRGYLGAGVLVAVIDTGVDYRHPAFLGAFPSLEDMHERGATHINQDSLTWIGWVGSPGSADDTYPLDPNFTGPFPGIPYGVTIPANNFRGFQYDNEPIWYGNYRFLGRNLMEGFHTVIPKHDHPHYYPMETFPGTPVPPHATASGLAAQTSHGSHVAGTIVGRDTGRDNSILGVAPEAQMIAYRVLAQGGGSITTILRGIEWSYLDRADVVNISIGGSFGTTNALSDTAINNLMLSENHQITFTLSAGNSGASGFYTMTSPSPATKALAVASFAEAEYEAQATFNGLNLDIESDLGFVTGNSLARWEIRDGRLISNFDRLAPDGTYRIFVMPRAEGSGSPVGEPGSGEAADFDLLFATYGEEVLQGAFVLVRRGSPFVTVSAEAFNRGLGGVISIDHNNNPGVAPQGSSPFWVPFFIIDHQPGFVLRDFILANTETLSRYETFYLTGSYSSIGLRAASSSSRGPIQMSFEIKPDIGANGVSVWSVNPRWHAVGYASSSGTSMSAPHVAGAVALLINYSRENGGQWCNEEIKVRLMNTAIRLDVPNFMGAQTEANIRGSVFDTGAGQVNVYAAANASSFVAVNYDRVVRDIRVVSSLDPFGDVHELHPDAFATTRTGSFSFGGVNRYSPYQAGTNLDRTLTATIENRSNAAVTYDISVEWIDYRVGYEHWMNQYHGDNGVYLEVVDSVVVAANDTADFTARMFIPADAAAGHYEGFINVSANGQLVASMPFAGVMAERPTLLNNMSLYRPVISTGDDAQNVTSSELGMNFIPQDGFSTRAWIFENAPGLTRSNWMDAEFSEYLVGFAGSNVVPAGGGDNFLFSGTNPGTRLTLGQMHRAVIFDGLYLPADEIWALFQDRPMGVLNDLNFIHRETEGAAWQLLSEGDYVIILEIGTSDWLWHFDALHEFSVDNTPPELNDVSVNGTAIQDGATMVVESSEVTIAGNVFDDWVAIAEAAGTTFDIWREGAPERQVSLQNNVAIFVQVEGQDAIRVEVDADGDFAVELTDLIGTNTVSIYAIDNYSVIPATDRLFSTIPARELLWINIPGTILPDGVGVNPRTLDHQGTFQIDGFLTVAAQLNESLNLADRLAYAPGFAGAAHAATRNQHVWSGLNVTEMTFTITDQEEPIISRLVMDNFEGIIDQTAATITFQIPEHFLRLGRFQGTITALEAADETVYFWVGGHEWPRRQGEAAGFQTGDLVYVAGGRIYTLIIETPQGEGLINHLRIGSVTGVINQAAATITFTVPRHLMVHGDQLRGVITQLDAEDETLIFFVAEREWPVSLGQAAGVSDGDLVYVAGGRVYTIRIVIR